MAIRITEKYIRFILKGCKAADAVPIRLENNRIPFEPVPFSENYTLNIHIQSADGDIIRIYHAPGMHEPFRIQPLQRVRLSHSGVPSFRPSIPSGAPFAGI